ncbi:MAG: DUF1499 domain-containing protein [Pseudomonadota bacterium]
MKLIYLILLLILAIQGFVRLSPVDPDRWHVRPEPPEGTDDAQPGGFTAQRAFTDPPEALLERLDAIALATPRTTRIAGSPSEGMITYQTRSAFFGFPDYTTIFAQPEAGGSRAIFHARLRFGAADLGVNQARVQSWLARLDG